MVADVILNLPTHIIRLERIPVEFQRGIPHC